MQPIGEPNRIKAPAGDGPRPQTSDERHSSDMSIRFAGARGSSFAALAQLVEHPALNRRVQGSIPWGGTSSDTRLGVWREHPVGSPCRSAVRIGSRTARTPEGRWRCPADSQTRPPHSAGVRSASVGLGFDPQGGFPSRKAARTIEGRVPVRGKHGAGSPVRRTPHVRPVSTASATPSTRMRPRGRASACHAEGRGFDSRHPLSKCGASASALQGHSALRPLTRIHRQPVSRPVRADRPVPHGSRE